MNEPMTRMECVQISDTIVVWRNTTTYPDGHIEVNFWNESRAEYDARVTWFQNLDWKKYIVGDDE